MLLTSFPVKATPLVHERDIRAGTLITITQFSFSKSGNKSNVDIKLDTPTRRCRKLEMIITRPFDHRQKDWQRLTTSALNFGCVPSQGRILILWSCVRSQPRLAALCSNSHLLPFERLLLMFSRARKKTNDPMENAEKMAAATSIEACLPEMGTTVNKLVVLAALVVWP